MLLVLVHFLHALFNYTYNRMDVRGFCAWLKLPLHVVVLQVFCDLWDCSNLLKYLLVVCFLRKTNEWKWICRCRVG